MLIYNFVQVYYFLSQIGKVISQTSQRLWNGVKRTPFAPRGAGFSSPKSKASSQATSQTSQRGSKASSLSKEEKRF